MNIHYPLSRTLPRWKHYDGIFVYFFFDITKLYYLSDSRKELPGPLPREKLSKSWFYLWNKILYKSYKRFYLILCHWTYWRPRFSSEFYWDLSLWFYFYNLVQNWFFYIYLYIMLLRSSVLSENHEIQVLFVILYIQYK